MPTNGDYWKSRFEQLENAQMNKGAEYYQEVDKQFYDAQMSIQKDIARWYERLSENNDITYAEAQKLLKKNELEEFHWTVEQYIKHGQENAITQQWMKQLENASSKVHISRLEAMQIQMQQEAEKLHGNMAAEMDKTLRNIYSEGYYKTAFEVQKGVGVGWTLHKIDTKKIDKVVSQCWTNDGKSFSDRVWSNKTKLVNEMNTTLSQSIIRGASPDKAINLIKERLNVSKSAAANLVMTESAFFASASQKDAFKDLDIEKYEIVATLDSSTSDICQEMDGKIFDMKDYQVGVTAPPFHCRCRSCTCPYFEDNFGERAAKDESGKTYYVPADMKYKDWKKEFVDSPAAKMRIYSPEENVKYSNKNDYSIHMEEYSEKVNEGISSAVEKVCISGSKDGFEHMCYVNLETGMEEYYETNGMKGSVGYKAREWAQTHSGSFAFIHNHNVVSSLSIDDYETPMLCENVPVIIASQNNGVKYIAKRTKMAPDGYYPDIYFEKDLEELNKLSRDGKIDNIERMIQREEILLECIEKEFYEKGVILSDGSK